METVSSKLSLYDFLSILTTGFLLILLSLGRIPEGEELFLIAIASYLVGLVFHWIIESTLGKLTRNSQCIVRKAYKLVQNSLEETPMSDYGKNQYLEAYYQIAKNNCLMNIPILEAQAAFVRNIWVIIPLYIIAVCICCPIISIMDVTFGSSYSVAIALTVLWLTLPFLWYSLQLKICKLVWEGGYFINNAQKNNE